MNYQTIDTATKDGSDIFVFVPGLGWRPAYWASTLRKWVSPVHCSIVYEGDDTPTHWMEEPEPPAQTCAQREESKD